jgi:hypothetical protein
MSKKKKSGNKKHTLETVLLVTAIIDLISRIIDLIQTLIE